MSRLTAELRALGRQLLTTGEVQVVIGYAASSHLPGTRPLFATTDQECDQLLWSPFCTANLTVYLTRPEVRQLGRPAIVAKGCDIRALVVLIQENQLARQDVVIIGMACQGVQDPRDSGRAIAAKCGSCQVQTPGLYDHLIGDKVPPAAGTPDLGGIERIAEMTLDQRWQFWQQELAKCTKCYACRAVCPLCYCSSCFTEKTSPAWTSSSHTARAQFFFHLFRAFHLTGRCVGCGECQRACPQEIPIGLLNQKMAQEIAETYSCQPGLDLEAKAAMLAFDPSDSDDFFR